MGPETSSSAGPGIPSRSLSEAAQPRAPNDLGKFSGELSREDIILLLSFAGVIAGPAIALLAEGPIRCLGVAVMNVAMVVAVINELRKRDLYYFFIATFSSGKIKSCLQQDKSSQKRLSRKTRNNLPAVNWQGSCHKGRL